MTASAAQEPALSDPDFSDRMTAMENQVQRMAVMEHPSPMSGAGRIGVLL